MNKKKGIILDSVQKSNDLIFILSETLSVHMHTYLKNMLIHTHQRIINQKRQLHRMRINNLFVASREYLILVIT